ncbi:thymidylate kinase [Pyrolobus fumarii 1A]|uniref:Probable thymidylate kinase n=1 Tax=Pyrolobus fumarii (strain DSM 11204 / 1A) TaxID=694429 RepID=G0ECM4_PYRF1|nr:dTMP kinase [Pyrolobus fumarii]AEM39594.1 thymidylate kinase [Pyrolobus fumarii 1A]
MKPASRETPVIENVIRLAYKRGEEKRVPSLPLELEPVLAKSVAKRLREQYGITIEPGSLVPRKCNGREIGVLIAIEGLDGAGTTTTSLALASILRLFVKNGKAVYTKEPTDNPIGVLIKSILRGHVDKSLMRPDILTHLFIADRIHHVYEENVAPGARGVVGAVAQGYLVVTDRYKYSNIAYQSSMDETNTYTMEDIMALNAVTPPAHILLYLDVEPEEALRRITTTRKVLETTENLELLRKVRNAYQKLLVMLKENPEWPAASPGETPWVTHVERTTGISVECIYPRDAQYPVIIKVYERDMSVEEMLVESLTRVIAKLVETGHLVQENGNEHGV